MTSYALEKQVCTRDQAEKLAELLGGDAPESLWVWSKIDAYGNWGIVLDEDYISNPLMHHNSDSYNAYTGDELSALLKNQYVQDIFPIHYTAEQKAQILIEDLEKGWIKKETLQY